MYIKKPFLLGLVGIIIPTSGLLAQQASIRVDAAKVENKITPLLYGSCIEDVNHEIYGGLYDQRIFGESFEEGAPGPFFHNLSVYDGEWQVKGKELHANPSAGGKLVYDSHVPTDGWAEVELKFDNTKGTNAGLLIRVSDAGKGPDTFNGYEISLSGNGKSLVLGRHRKNWQLINQMAVDVNPTAWNLMRVEMNGSTFKILLNGKEVITYTDTQEPLMDGSIAVRTWNSDVNFCNFKFGDNSNHSTPVVFKAKQGISVSSQWKPIYTEGMQYRFLIDEKGAFNGKNSQMIESFASGILGVSNMSLNGWGIALRQGQTFKGGLYLKGVGMKGNVTVALQSADGSKEYACAKISDISGNWHKHEFTLTSTTFDPKARFAVYIDQPGKLWIDQVTLMSTGKEQFHGLPVRNDIGQAIVNQKLTFLRYGGCMTNSPDYRFKKMVGDRDKRPPYKGWWNPQSTNGFGVIEFMQFAEAAGITPSFAVNIEETPEDMADMIEYFNGSVTSEWGKKRAEDGHPEPYNLKYIEIGNEEVLPNGDVAQEYDHYIERFHLLYKAIKAKDPNVVFITAAWWRPNSLSIEKVFHALDGKAEYWDYHPWADALNSGEIVEKELKEMKELFLKWNPNTTMKCVIFEENGNTHTMQRALGHATIQNAARRLGEFLLTSCAANALQPYLQNDNEWDQGQIFFTPSQVWGMPPYYAQQMASEHHKSLRVYSKTTSGLDVTATCDEQADELVLHIINTKGEKVKADMDITGFVGARQVKVFTLSGELNEINTPLQPERIIPVEKTLHRTEALIYEFPAYSYTIMVYSK